MPIPRAGRQQHRVARRAPDRGDLRRHRRAAVRADHHLPGRRHHERRTLHRAGPLGRAGSARRPGQPGAGRIRPPGCRPGTAVGSAARRSDHRPVDPLCVGPVRRRLVETAAVSAWRTVTDLAGELPQSGDPLRHHRRQRGVLRRRRPPARRHHRLRRPDPVVGRRRTRGDGVVGAAPRRWRTGWRRCPLIAAFHRRAAAATAPRSPRCGRCWCCAPPPWWSAATSRPPSMPTTTTPQVLWSAEWRIFERAMSVPADVMTARRRRRARPARADRRAAVGVGAAARRCRPRCRAPPRLLRAVRHLDAGRLAGSCVRGAAGGRGTGGRRAGRRHRVCRAATDQIRCAAQ